ncbi:DUF2206 domain-containing protein [Halorientalis halophila]|uniref:DUF2206 domain-containing protein n=1 Tax=Halorientalis halophila TaxID=3108499 RepID=UPI00300A17FB
MSEITALDDGLPSIASALPVRLDADSLVVRFTGTNLLLVTVAFVGLINGISVVETYVWSVPLLRELLGIVFLTFVPGLIVLVVLGYPDESVATTACFAFGLSLISIMLVGAVASIVLPEVGIARVIELPVLSLSYIGFAALGAAVSDGDITLVLERDQFVSPVTLGLLLLPFLSVLGSVYYHQTGTNSILLALVLVIALLPVCIVAFSDESWYFPLVIWCVSLALLYHGRVIQFYTFTQPLPQITMEQGRWIPNYGAGVGSLLANGVLFPSYAVVTGLPIEVEWNLVNPLLVSFLPVTLYEMFRRYFSPRAALLSVFIFVSSYSFYVLYPTAGRAATPVIFLALLGLAFSTDRLSPRTQHVSLLAFGFGIAVSHYGTAYVVMFALVVGAVAFKTLQLLFRFGISTTISEQVRRVAPAEWFGTSEADLDLETPSILRPSFIGFYAALAISWYLYTAKGAKFATLPRKVLDAMYGVLYTQVTGSAATSFQQSYQAQAITISKYLYVVFGLLMAIGIAATAIRLVVFRDQRVDPGFLAVGTGFFSMFIGSLLPSGNAFAVARVMMIIFVFAVPFAVVGVRELAGAGRWFGRRIGRLSRWVPWPSGSVAIHALAVLLAVFLLLNIGFVSETVTHDVAPSNSLSEHRLEQSENPPLRLRTTKCVPCNIQSHAWVGNKIPPGEATYADITVENQLDFYRGSITAAAPNGTFGYVPIQMNQTDVPSNSYLVLQPRNTDLGGFPIGYKFNFYRKNMSEFTDGNQIYTSGYNHIYHKPSFNRTNASTRPTETPAGRT